MPSPVTTILDFNLPNATTWLFFSFLLAMALFFKFSRLFSVRNLDVIMIFLSAPGLVVVQATRPQPRAIEQQAVQITAFFGQHALVETPVEVIGATARFATVCGPAVENYRWLWWGYAWLLIGSIYLFCRCLLDLTLVQRPALAPNLQVGGLAWLAGALMMCLLAVAYRQAERQFNADASPAAAASPFLLLHPSNQPVFAVAALWQNWPVWAVAMLAFAGHCVVVVGLVLIGWRHFQDVAIGMAAATFYLLLPYTGMSVGQLHHVLPMELFLGALLMYRYPMAVGFLLGVATAATYIPLFVLPIWLSFYRQQGAGRFLFAFTAGASLALWYLGATLARYDQLEASIQLAIRSTGWQPWRDPKAEGFWLGVHWAYRIPVFLLFLSFVIGTAFWPVPKNLAHVIALSAAVFIALQWWFADQGGVYVLWYLPLLLLMVFRPNLQDRVAPDIIPEKDWLSRMIAWLVAKARRFLRIQELAKTDVAS